MARIVLYAVREMESKGTTSVELETSLIEALDPTVPPELRGGRKSAIKVSAALRQYLKRADLHLVNDNGPTPARQPG